MYYNMAITLWMNLTSDLQIVHSGLNKAISPTTGKLTGIDTVVVAGTRLRVRFQSVAAIFVAPPAQAMAYR
jgi:hypothetical protein